VRLLLLGPINSPHVEHLALAMRERGHEVAVAGETAAALGPSGLAEAGIPTTEIRGRNLLAVRRAVRGARPDVVHAHWLPGAAFMAALVRARPLISMAWGSDVYASDRRRRLQSRYALRHSDVAMADSRDLLDRMVDLGAAPERTFLMRWGVDLDMFSPAPDRAASKRDLGLPGDAPVVVSARGLAPVYNPEVVLDAFGRLRERVPDALLLLKTPGEPPGDLPPGVRAVGGVPYEQLPAYFRAADVCISIPRSDSSPRSVWEAMACGCPCVLSDLPWTRELIEDGRHALLTATEPDAVAASLERAVTDSELATRLSDEGRALVERHHDRDAEMRRLSDLYASLAQ
jgi:glycosyltransferase involved in cell wall biosynthesis